jgi:ankyrin repeat protein
MPKQFPTYVMPIDVVMKLEKLETHEEMMRRGDLVLWEPGMPDFAFISQAWLGRSHPDPKGVKLSLLQKLLQGIIDGDVSINNFWMEEILFAPSSIEASTLQKSLSNGYIWWDYSCVPQHCTSEMMRAVNSIHCYIQESAHFIVLQPASMHENGQYTDIRRWGTRGWCRAERICNVLSPSAKPVIVVETLASKYTQMPRDWLLHPVGQGQFTEDSDKEHLGMVLESLVMQRQQKALEDNDLRYYRLLVSMKSQILSGCWIGSGGLPDNSFEQWMEEMRFTRFDDEQDSGWSPLRFAIYAGRLDIASELLRRGADVDAPLKANAAQWGFHLRGCTVLSGLCGLRSNPEAIRFLLQHKANPFLTDDCLQTPLHLAGTAGFNENISELMSLVPELATMCDVHGVLPSLRCVMSGNKEAFANYVEKYPSTMSFDPNWCNWYGGGVVSHAIMDVGDPDMLQAVIDLGYDINHRADITKAIRLPLRLMKMCQAISFFTRGNESTLISYMANSPGMTPLILAAFMNNTKQLKMCLEAGADVSTTNDYNRTPLMFAAMTGNEEMVEILLEAKSPVGVTDTWGRTAADWAEIRGYPGIADKLRSLGDDGGKGAQPRLSRQRTSLFGRAARKFTTRFERSDKRGQRKTPNTAIPSRSFGSPFQCISDLFMY